MNKLAVAHIINTLFTVLFGLYVNQVMHWFYVPFKLNLYVILAVVLVLNYAKMMLLPDDMQDPVKKQGIVRTCYYLSLSVLMTGILFKVMHWPGADILLILSFGIHIGALLLSFNYNDQPDESSILDDDL